MCWSKVKSYKRTMIIENIYQELSHLKDTRNGRKLAWISKASLPFSASLRGHNSRSVQRITMVVYDFWSACNELLNYEIRVLKSADGILTWSRPGLLNMVKLLQTSKFANIKYRFNEKLHHILTVRQVFSESPWSELQDERCDSSV